MFRKLSRGQLIFDLVAPVALFAVLLLPYASSRANVIVLFGMCAALIFRRLAPGIALSIAWLTAIGQMAMGIGPDPANLAILAVLYGTAAYGGPVVRWLGLGSVGAGAVAITLYMTLQQIPAELSAWDPTLQSDLVNGFIRSALITFFTSLIAFGLAWTGGQLVRTSGRAQESRRAAIVAEQEVVAEQERTRIARDMHDVVAHSLAVVVAQADGARYLGASDPQATEAALATIATTAREALSDVRVLLAQLRYSQGDAPQPTLVDLDRLVEQVHSAGLSVVRETSGIPLALGTAQQLAVYRIVQESLTNALRHADLGHDVVLRFEWTPYGLELTITSALVARADRGEKPDKGRPQAPLGHGIAGMTERAVLVGGHLTASADGNEFVVRAWLPAQPNAALSISAEAGR